MRRGNSNGPGRFHNPHAFQVMAVTFNYRQSPVAARCRPSQYRIKKKKKLGSIICVLVANDFISAIVDWNWIA